MNSPAVSVILPAYNCEKHIGKAIQSVLQQSLADFELIIINDGSIDKTETIILQFIDPRIIYIKNPENKGLIHTLNRAFPLPLIKSTIVLKMTVSVNPFILPERISLARNILFILRCLKKKFVFLR